jgi:hypothetical protein
MEAGAPKVMVSPMLRIFLVLLFSSAMSAQSLPRTFVVDKEHWEVAYSSDEKIMNDADGITTFTDGENPQYIIYIRLGLSKAEEKDVFLHELLHVAIKSTSAEYKCRRKFEEEGWIARMEPRLFKILHDNPQLLKYFSKQ